MKYMGSKAKYAKAILPITLAGRRADQWYVEPFVGGANVIDKVGGLRLGNDVNRYLVALLIALRDGWVPPDITRDEYVLIRNNKGSYTDAIVGWAGIGCSYSGKWFGGYAGVVQTRAGVRDYIAEAKANCAKQAKLLGGVEFRAGPYHELAIPSGSIVYCDPPYANTTAYKDPFDTAAFWAWCEELAASGHRVYVSEYVAPSRWSCVWEGRATSSLSANGKVGGNKVSTERLFTL